MNIVAEAKVAPYHKGIKEIPSQEYLRECFDYRDGWLYWKRRPVEHFSCIRIANGSNTQFAGKRVGNLRSPKGKTPYFVSAINGKMFYVHRIIWKMMIGDIPDHLEIDHINGDSLDNRIENLRLVSRSQNMINRNRKKKSGLPKGVCRNRGTFVARIKNNGIETVLGYFTTAEQASNAYQQAANELHGEFARKPAPPQLEAGPEVRSS